VQKRGSETQVPVPFRLVFKMVKKYPKARQFFYIQ